MKKLNKKGVTLIELIVSFAIVSIAMIYFYQTIVDLHRMYKNSNKATDEFVNKDYALRVLDAYIKNGNGLNDILPSSDSQVRICENYDMFCDDDKTEILDNNNFKKIILKDKEKKMITEYYKWSENETVDVSNLCNDTSSIFYSECGKVLSTNLDNSYRVTQTFNVTNGEKYKLKYKIKSDTTNSLSNSCIFSTEDVDGTTRTEKFGVDDYTENWTPDLIISKENGDYYLTIKEVSDIYIVNLRAIGTFKSPNVLCEGELVDVRPIDK